MLYRVYLNVWRMSLEWRYHNVSVMVTSSCRVVRGGGCLHGRQSSRRCRCRRQTAVYRRADSEREYKLDHKTTNRRRERRTAVQDPPRHSPTNKHQQPHHVAVCTENQSVNQSISVLRRFMYKLLLSERFTGLWKTNSVLITHWFTTKVTTSPNRNWFALVDDDEQWTVI